MGETEVRTAETSGTVTNASSQASRPKSKSSKRSSAPAKRASVKLNERGVPVTAWDNPRLDPNKRKHVGEDPTGERNKLS